MINVLSIDKINSESPYHVRLFEMMGRIVSLLIMM